MSEFAHLVGETAPDVEWVTTMHGRVAIDRKMPGKTVTLRGQIKDVTFTITVPDNVDIDPLIAKITCLVAEHA